ncbi:MAG: biopolymer transporter ExbD [Bdellovibrionales bacterium]|nr:biopolymer transporter ExbD [Bdellovibrionales bacterium]
MSDKQSFELDLMPVISLLAVIISFLLLTSVWIHISSLEISQALGTDSDRKVEPTLSASFEGSNIKFEVKDSTVISKGKRSLSINDWKEIESYSNYLVKKDPRIKIAMILPAGASKYQDIVRLIDVFKARGIIDVGIAPL